MRFLIDSNRMEIAWPAVFRRLQFPKLSWRLIPALLLIGILILLLAYPMGLLFVKSFVASRPGQPTVWTINGWIAAFTDATLLIALGNTFFLALMRVVITSGLAIFFAWVVTRTDTPLKGFIEIALWLGFFLPLLPMTMGWILLLDPHYGLINKFFMRIFALAEAPFNIYSYGGIIWCHLAFSTSVRFMLMTPAFAAMDAALEEAGQVCGSNKAGVLMRVTIPVLAPAVLASTVLGFIRSLESLEIEMVLGLPAGIYVVSTKIWDFIHWEPPLYDRATALCSIFLLLIFLLIWLHRSFLHGREFTTISGRSHMVESFTLGRWRWVTCALCLLFIVLMIILPLATLVMGTFMEFFGHFQLEKAWTTRHWTGVFTDLVFLRSLKNTVILGLGAATVGTLVYALISYLIVRTHLPGRGLIQRPLVVALGLAGSIDQSGALVGGFRLGRLCQTYLWDGISFSGGDYHQRDATGSTDYQSCRPTGQPGAGRSVQHRGGQLVRIFSSHLVAPVEANASVCGHHRVYFRRQRYTDSHFPVDP